MRILAGRDNRKERKGKQEEKGDQMRGTVKEMENKNSNKQLMMKLNREKKGKKTRKRHMENRMRKEISREGQQEEGK